MTDSPVHSSTPEGRSALDQILELTVARLLDMNESTPATFNAIPTFDAVLESVIEDLSRDPLQLRTLIGAAVSVSCVLATYLEAIFPEGGDAATAVRVAVSDLSNLPTPEGDS